MGSNIYVSSSRARLFVYVIEINVLKRTPKPQASRPACECVRVLKHRRPRAVAVFPRSVFLRPRFFLHEDELIETELKRFKKDDSAKINKKCPAYENAISLFVENHGSPQCSITSKNKSFREPCAARKRDVLGRSKTTEYKGVAATPARYGSIANDTSCHHKKKKTSCIKECGIPW